MGAKLGLVLLEQAGIGFRLYKLLIQAMTPGELLTYNVPLSLLNAFVGRRVIVRSGDPAAVVQDVLPQHLTGLVALQLLDISAPLDELEDWNPGLPIEIVLADPEPETMKLHRLCKLQRSHPVRVVIPVVPGFSKAARVASFLHLPVKLEGTQPDLLVIEELTETLDFFLHNKAVLQPIEYFSGLLTTVIHKQPVTLWEIQEEDPSSVRYITESGDETVARRPITVQDHDLDSFHFELTKYVLDPDAECASCEFFLNCGGYFKWPRRDFSCDGIKRVFERLRVAALEIHDDLSLYPVVRTEPAR